VKAYLSKIIQARLIPYIGEVLGIVGVDAGVIDRLFIDFFGDYWVLGLCASSGIRKNVENTTFRKLYLFPSSGEGMGDMYSASSVRRS
jgi:hypothetical protein